MRQRLGARPQPQTHPDPDTLSAYVEQVLSPAERVRIIEHLADCRDCREVVALSLPQLAPQQPVLQVAPRSRWWAPAYRWATLAAAVAVATTLIVERPWQKPSQPTPSRQEQAAAPSGKTESANLSPNQPAGSPTETAPATRSAASTAAPKTPATPVTADDKALQATSQPELRGQNTTESSPLPRAARPRIVGGAVGGVSAGTGQLAVHQAVAPATLMASPAATPPPPPKATDGELRDTFSQNGAASKETVEVTAAADSVLPLAPQPQPKQDTSSVRKFTPPLSSTGTQNAMAPEIVAPNVSPSQPPSPADNSLARMRYLGEKKGKSKLEATKSAVVDAAKKVMEAANPVKPPSGAAQGFVGPAMAPPREEADTQSEFRRELRQQPRWTIGSKGELLMKSDAVSQWHEAYTQNPNVQFRVVVTEGRQVWAGGSNATLIHSWDGGVKWDTMKVPDAGDITQITIDEGWQVKTSNGQTFVSTDHGQTWVPLEQPK